MPATINQITIPSLRSRSLILIAANSHPDCRAILRLGLVTQVSRDQPPLAIALDLARAFAAKPPEAVAATRRLARQGLSEAVLSRFEHEIEVINGLLAPGMTR